MGLYSESIARSHTQRDPLGVPKHALAASGEGGGRGSQRSRNLSGALVRHEPHRGTLSSPRLHSVTRAVITRSNYTCHCTQTCPAKSQTQEALWFLPWTSNSRMRPTFCSLPAVTATLSGSPDHPKRRAKRLAGRLGLAFWNAGQNHMT